MTRACCLIFIIAALSFGAQPASATPENDDFAAAAVLTGPSGRTTSSNRLATREAGEPRIADEDGGHSLWWQWTAPSSAMVTVDTFGSDFDTLLGVYTGSELADLLGLGENDDAESDVQSQVRFRAVAGTAYHFAVDGYDRDESGGIVLNWSSRDTDSPSNDDFAAADVLDGSSDSVDGTNVEATREAGEPRIEGQEGGRSVWWRWVAPSSGSVTVDTLDSDFDTLLGVFRGERVDALELVAENDDIDAGPARVRKIGPIQPPPGDLDSRVDFEAVAGATYHFVVDGYDGESGIITLTWSQDAGIRPENDAFAGRLALEGPQGVARGTNHSATAEPGEPDHAGGGSRSVWWSWVAPHGGTARFRTLGSGFDTVLAVYTGEAVGNLTLVAENDDADVGDESTSAVTFAAASGTEYQIAVDGSKAVSGSVRLEWSLAEPQFRRGDVVVDGTIDLADAIACLRFLFLGAPPECLRSADVDDSGSIDLTDPIFLLEHLFLGGSRPDAPFVRCGIDRTPDPLSCESADACRRA